MGSLTGMWFQFAAVGGSTGGGASGVGSGLAEESGECEGFLRLLLVKDDTRSRQKAKRWLAVVCHWTWTVKNIARGTQRVLAPNGNWCEGCENMGVAGSTCW